VHPSLPSSIGTVRGWMRSNVPITTLTGQRQYFGMPRKDKPATPFVLMYRVGGAPDNFGQDYPQLIIECWADTKTLAEELGLVVAAEIQYIRRPVLVAGQGVVMSGKVNLGPIETSGTPDARRYRIDATFHLRSQI
jgi:hypothetical protein